MKKRHPIQSEVRAYPTFGFFVRVLSFALLVTQFFTPVAPAFANEVVDDTPSVPLMTEVEEVESDSAPPPPHAPSEVVDEPTAIEEVSSEIPDESNQEVEVPGGAPSGEALAEDIPPTTHGEVLDVVDVDDTGNIAIVPDTSEAGEEGVGQEERGSTTPPTEYEEGNDTEPREDIPTTTPPHTIEESESTTTEEVIPPHEVPPVREVVGTTTDDATIDPPIEVPDDTGTTTGTTTPVETVVEAHTVVNDTNRYAFGIDECTRVADGSFYCQERDTENKGATLPDGVMAGPDQDGDSEIFVTKNGETVQITQNLLHDAAPSYDGDSNTVVWHRLIDGRYQIIEYDIETKKEKQLTYDSFNNMQPSQSEEVIVWQGWVGNDWEIFLYEDGEATMLTDNTTHDIGPQIHDGYIIWQSREGDAPSVVVYNIETKTRELLTGNDGEAVMNPRVVLVYDTKDDRGDSRSIGYDLETGKRESLSVIPVELPDELPDPEQTGEERALISIITGGKAKPVEEDDDDMGSTTTVPVVPPTDEATTSTDIIVPPLTHVQDGTGTSTEETATVPVDPIFDVAIPPQSIATPPVPDLVIPPYEEVQSGNGDPQTGVAETL